MIAAEKHLLRRQFQQAQTTAHAALLNLQPPTSPFGIVTATTTTTTKPQGLVSLRPFPEQHTVSPSSFSQLEELVRLCAVWMQATAELQHLDHPNHNHPTPSGPDALSFVPNLVQLHLPQAPALPYVTSMVWLTYLAKMGAVEHAKEAILCYLCTPEGRLYTQAHWRAVTASLGQVPSAENTRDAQSRYEHLIEVLVLDVLVPLGEATTALEFIDKDISLSAERRQSLWHLVKGDWKDRASETKRATREDSNDENAMHDAVGGYKQEHGAAKDETWEGDGGARGVKDEEERKENAHMGGSLGQLSAQKKVHGVDPVEQGLTREDVEVLCVGVATVVAVGVAGWVAWRKRGSLLARFQRFQSIGGFLS